MECRQSNAKPNYQLSTAPKQCHYCTLWIKRLSCSKMHNIITDNCKKIRPEYQLFDSTSERRLQRPQLLQKHNVRIKSRVQNDHRLPWHKLKDDDATDAQLQQWWRDVARHTRFWFWCDIWGRQDQWCVFSTPSPAVCSALCSQLNLNRANVEDTVAVKRNLAFLFPGTPR